MNPHMSHLLSRLLVASWLAGLCIGLSGCGTRSAPTESEGSEAIDLMKIGDGLASSSPGHQHGSRGFYPLQVGNRWTYVTQFSSLVVPDSCDTLPGGIILCQAEGSFGSGFESRELIGTEVMFDREYVVEAQKMWTQPSIRYPDTTTYWTRYRQDRSGLYEADTFLSVPPGPVAASDLADLPRVLPLEQKLSAALAANGLSLTLSEAAAYDEAMSRIQKKLEMIAEVQGWFGMARSASGGRRSRAGEHELTRLRYPLHRGQTWMIREEPYFSARVVGHDVLELPAGRLGGWKIRIESVYFDPEDKVHFWCGRTGFLRMSASGQSVALDEWGNRVGTVHWSQSSELLNLELVQP